MKWLRFKQNAIENTGERQNVSGESRRGGIIKNSLYQLAYNLKVGAEYTGVGLMIIGQAFVYSGAGPEKLPYKPDTTMISQYLPSRVAPISVQEGYNQFTNEYETKVMLAGSGITDAFFKTVFEFLRDNVFTLSNAAVLGSTVGAYLLLGLPKAMKKNPDGTYTLTYKGKVDPAVMESVKNKITDYDYSGIVDEAAKVNAEERFKNTKAAVEKIVIEKPFEASDFPDYKSMNYDEVKAIVEDKLSRIRRQIRLTDPAALSSFNIDAEAVLKPWEGMRSPSTLAGVVNPTPIPVGTLVKNLNKLIEDEVADAMSGAKTAILADEKAKIEFDPAKAKAILERRGGVITETFTSLAEKKALEMGAKTGQPFELTGTPLGEVTCKTVTTAFSTKDKKGLSDEDFARDVEKLSEEIGKVTVNIESNEVKRFKWLRSIGGKRMIKLGGAVVVGALVWYAFNSDSISGGSANLDPITATNGMKITDENQKNTLRVPGGEVKIGNFLYRNEAQPQKDYKFKTEDIKVYDVNEYYLKNPGIIEGKVNNAFYEDANCVVSIQRPDWFYAPKVGDKTIYAMNGIYNIVDDGKSRGVGIEPPKPGLPEAALIDLPSVEISKDEFSKNNDYIVKVGGFSPKKVTTETGGAYVCEPGIYKLTLYDVDFSLRTYKYKVEKLNPDASTVERLVVERDAVIGEEAAKAMTGSKQKYIADKHIWSPKAK